MRLSQEKATSAYDPIKTIDLTVVEAVYTLLEASGRLGIGSFVIGQWSIVICD